jgi:hypothetical protein
MSKVSKRSVLHGVSPLTTTFPILHSTLHIPHSTFLYGVAVALFLLSGCSIFNQGDEATVTIHLGSATNGRSAWHHTSNPALLDKIEYNVQLSGGGRTVVTLTAHGGTTVRASVTPGSWNVEVRAFIDGFYYATGSSGINVKAGQNNTVSITMRSTNYYYELGDKGPGGGTVFYRNASGFTSTYDNTICHYLEAMPVTWYDGTDDPQLEWGITNPFLPVDVKDFATRDIAGTETGIGTGRRNTWLIRTDGDAEDYGAGLIPAAYYAGAIASDNGTEDWFLPSKDELTQLYISRSVVGDITPGNFWSSSQYPMGNTGAYDSAWSQDFSGANNEAQANIKSEPLYVRPIRSF